MKKYIVANLKKSLNDNNVNDYIEVLKNNKYENLIICPEYKYIKLFNSNTYHLGSQDYYDDIFCEYVIINHHDNIKNNIKEKIKKSLSKNMKVILCIGNDSLGDLESLKTQINTYLEDINNYENIIIAYEPYFMISSDIDVDINKVKINIDFIKSLFNKKINVFYGGNVNENNIEEILKISDGVLIGRFGFNIQNLTNTINKFTKNI